MSDPLAAFETALTALPAGTFNGRAGGLRYIVTKTVFNAGKSIKLVAEELGGTDYISLNLYRLRRGVQLSTCEMSAQKVTEFVLNLRPDVHHDAA